MSANYSSSVQQRVLRVLDLLMHAGLHGLCNKEIATHLDIGADKVTRDIANLFEAGFVEQDAEREGLWRVSPRICRIATSVMRDLDRSHDKLREIQTRYLGQNI